MHKTGYLEAGSAEASRSIGEPKLSGAHGGFPGGDVPCGMGTKPCARITQDSRWTSLCGEACEGCAGKPCGGGGGVDPTVALSGRTLPFWHRRKFMPKKLTPEIHGNARWGGGVGPRPAPWGGGRSTAPTSNIRALGIPMQPWAQETPPSRRRQGGGREEGCCWGCQALRWAAMAA